MNILHVISTMDPVSGGTCQGIRNSNDALEKLGVHAEVVCLDSPDSSFLGKDNFVIHALGKGKGPWQYSPNLRPWLEQNLERFDAVILNGLWLSCGYITWKCVQDFKKRAGQIDNAKKGIKFFVMPHGMLDPYFQKAEERKLKALRNKIYWKLIERKVVNDADGLLFTCETELLLARQTFAPYHPKSEINVGYGVVAPPQQNAAMELVFKQKCPEVGNAPYLLFLSRIHEKKGVDILVEAYKSIQAKLVKEGIVVPKLVIAGPGMDSAYGEKVKKMAEEQFAPKDAIIFPGMLTGDAKWGAFYGAEAFVLPSHQENFGFAVTEALACGTPVLISNQVNIWREIQNAKGGIVANDTVEGTTEMLEQWIKMPTNEKYKMREQAYQAYLQFFDIRNAAKSFSIGIGNAETEDVPV